MIGPLDPFLGSDGFLRSYMGDANSPPSLRRERIPYIINSSIIYDAIVYSKLYARGEALGCIGKSRPPRNILYCIAVVCFSRFVG